MCQQLVERIDDLSIVIHDQYRTFHIPSSPFFPFLAAIIPPAPKDCRFFLKKILICFYSGAVCAASHARVSSSKKRRERLVNLLMIAVDPRVLFRGELLR